MKIINVNVSINFHFEDFDKDAIAYFKRNMRCKHIPLIEKLTEWMGGDTDDDKNRNVKLKINPVKIGNDFNGRE